VSDDALLLLSRKPAPPPLPPRPAPEPRTPLPPFDEGTWESPDANTPASYHPVYTELTTTPALFGDPRWWRGDCWGVTIPGLPPVEGGASGPAQDRVLSYFLGRYGRDWEDRILEANLVRGHTHFSLSPQDEFAAGMSTDDYVAMSVRVRQAGFNVHHLLRSKYYTEPASVIVMGTGQRRRRLRAHLDPPDLWGPHISRAAFDPASMRPLIEQLLAAGAAQVFTPAWEMNFWSPTACRAMIDHDAAVIGMNALIEIHFYPHYISWQEPDETPTDFWLANYGKVDGVLYQCDPFWSAGMMTARVTDALDRLAPGGIWGLGDSGRGHPIDVVTWETIATCQYNGIDDGNGREADEDQGNRKGFELLCTPGAMAPYGFGNGGRAADGTVL
jgi:hypothetical protein